MGSRLTARAMMPLPELGLSPTARLVLVQMCRMAKDNDDPPIYYGGWPFLAEGLGYESYTLAAKSAVARAVREVTGHGIVKPRTAPVRGETVHYEIRL